MNEKKPSDTTRNDTAMVTMTLVREILCARCFADVLEIGTAIAKVRRLGNAVANELVTLTEDIGEAQKKG